MITLINFKFNLQRFFSSGNGTSSNPYRISSQADLEQLRNDVNRGNPYEGVYFKVTNDIALTGNWTPIGGLDKNAGIFGVYRRFKGVFDGGGFTISGMTIREGNGYPGLFGLTREATIRNVNLTGVDIMAGGQVGAIVGCAEIETNITNCSAQGTIKAYANSAAGGIVGTFKRGFWNSDIKNCAFFGTVENTDGNRELGIIAGSSETSLAGNYYYGDAANINTNDATRIYDFNVPEGVTIDGAVTFAGKSYIKAGDATFKYLGNSYKYNVTGNVTVTIKDNKFFANDTDLGSAVPDTLEGNGSANNPYLIKTEDDLRKLATYVNYGNDCAGLNFKLAKDITLTSEWTPIGSKESKSFRGNFDGDGHTVSGLTINNRVDSQGLFGTVDSVTIQNVYLTGANVKGGSFIGALVGTVTGNSQILNCFAQGNVESSDRLAYAGGLVGALRIYTGNSVIDGCAFSGTVKAIKASNDRFFSYGGGIIGINDGTVKNSVFLGGSFDCVNKGAIVGRQGGRCIDNYYYGTLADDVYPNRATQVFRIAVPEGVTSDSIVTLGGIKFVKAGDATFTYNGNTYNYTVNDNLAVSVEGDNLSFGKLDMAEDFLSTLEGNGSENNPYFIKSEDDLRRFSNYVLYGKDCAGLNFKLSNDITLTKNFTAIGTEMNPFSGNFDGSGKTISNLTISGGDNQGLFGKVNGSTIKNLNLTGVNVTGKNNVGSLVGYAAGNSQILNCFAQGDIKGSENVGGLVGINDGTIKDGAYLGGSITGTTKGVIVGKNNGTLTDNYYFGTLSSDTNSNDATQLFNVTLPEGVTSNALVEINGTKYIKGGNVILNLGHKNYYINVTSDVTVTIDGNKLFVNDTECIADFLGNLEGEGTENNPFLLKSQENLRQLATYVNNGNNCAGVTFKLTEDIKLTGNWTPIGKQENSFNGTFDGDNHTVSGLTINGDDKRGIIDKQGFFGYVNNATLKNVNLTGVNINTNGIIGSLAAYVYKNTQILNCSAQGNLNSKSFLSPVGGLVGYITGGGTIDGCTFSGNIEGLSVPGEFPILGSHVGGIVGACLDGSVKNCAYLGGTIKSSDGGAITSKISKPENFIDNYYYGKLDEGIKDSGATQIFKVTLPDGVTSNALVEINGTKYIKGGNVSFDYGGNSYNYTVNDDITVTIDGNKFFVNNTETETSLPGNGDGSANNPFLIKTEKDLRQLAEYVNGGNDCAGVNFKLSDNITLTGDWTPIGTQDNHFKGTFDGDNHTVSNLTINGDDNQGLFGYTVGATIQNVKLTGVSVTGKDNVGSLVGNANNSQIINCSTSGTIKSTVMKSYVGGLIGRTSANVTVDGCTFSGSVEGFESARFSDIAAHSGGLVGINDGSTIKNSAFLGNSIKGGNCGVITSEFKEGGTLTDNYYLGTLAEGVDNNNATQIFNVTMPEGVTSTALIDINGTKYIKGGNVTLNYNGNSYNYNVTGDITVTIQDNKIYVGGEELNSAPKLAMVSNENPDTSADLTTLNSSDSVEGKKLYADDNGSTLTGGLGNDSLWGGAGKDTFIYNGGNDIIYGFGTGDTLITNGFNDISPNFNAVDNYINIPCGTGSVTLKDFTTNEFAINSDTWTLSGNTISKN